MTPIERQILENQLAIMNGLRIACTKEGYATRDLLNPINEEDCCEMPESYPYPNINDKFTNVSNVEEVKEE